MNRLTLLSVVVVVALPTLVAAQPKPNFSGTWKCDTSRTTGGSCTTDAIVIKHSGDTITVQSVQPSPIVQTYKLDGTETTNDPAQKLGNSGRPLGQLKVTGRWEGTAAVIETRTLEEPPRVTKSTWRLSADGKELVIDSDRGGRGTVVWIKAGS